MNTGLLFSLSSTILLLACAGCRTPSPEPSHAKGDPAVDFGSYRTFALLPPTTKTKLDPADARALIAAAETGARDALQNAGYTETNRENADVIFYLHGKVLMPVAVTDLGYQPALASFGTSPADVAANSNSRVFVEAYDNHTKRQVWMNWIVCTCINVLPTKLHGEVHHILEEFPARAPANTVSLTDSLTH